MIRRSILIFVPMAAGCGGAEPVQHDHQDVLGVVLEMQLQLSEMSVELEALRSDVATCTQQLDDLGQQIDELTLGTSGASRRVVYEFDPSIGVVQGSLADLQLAVESAADIRVAYQIGNNWHTTQCAKVVHDDLTNELLCHSVESSRAACGTSPCVLDWVSSAGTVVYALMTSSGAYTWGTRESDSSPDLDPDPGPAPIYYRMVWSADTP